jgi:tetratricopeptide (TPR) repeat protein
VKVTGKQVFNNACGKCHDAQLACTEKENIRIAQGNNCVGCHMPKSGTIDIPHVTVTDHWIRKPVRSQQKKDIKKFAGIYCINNKQSDNYTHAQAYLNYVEKFEGENTALDSAAHYIQQAGEEEGVLDAKIHLLFLRQDYRGIVLQAKNFKPQSENNPWLCYRIGQAYQNLSDFAAAESWYNRAVQLAGENLDFLNKYGTILVELNKTDEGIKVLRTSLEKNPKQSEALTNMGFAYLKKEDLKTAMTCYDRALALDPDMRQALFNKAALCNMTGDRKQAAALLKQILKRDPDNEYVKQLLQGL